MATEPLHPLRVKGRARIALPPHTECATKFNFLVHSGEPAMLVYGEPDVGKTTFISTIVELAEVTGAALVYKAVLSGASTDANMLIRKFQESRPGPESRRFSHNMDVAFRQRIQADAEISGCTRVYLVIDEAQLLSKQMLEYMRCLMEELLATGFAPFFLLVGQPETVELPKNLFRINGDASLLSRFFSRIHRYRGLRLDEIKTYLEALDSERWPGEGPTYTEAFAKSFWDKGNRMAHLSSKFEESFKQLLLRSGRQQQLEVPVKYVASAAKWTLDKLGEGQTPELNIPEVVNDAVLNSGAAQCWDFMNALRAEAAAKSATTSGPRASRRRPASAAF